MNQAFKAFLLASTTALAACQGGGSSSNDNGSNTFTPINVSPVVDNTPTSIGGFDISNLSQNEFTAVVQQVSEDGKVTAQEIVNVFEWMNANHNIDYSELSQYTVEVNGSAMSLDSAYNILKGYKKLYYDNKEQWWSRVVETGQYDDASEEYHYIKEYVIMESNGYIDHADIGADENFSLDDFHENTQIQQYQPEVEETTQPVVVEPEPIVETTQPVEETVQPEVVEQPVEVVEETTQPEVVEQPVEETTNPVVEVVEETVQPEVVETDPTPEPVVEQPVEVVEETVQPVTETTETVEETITPVVEETTQPVEPVVEETTEPVVEQPVEVVEEVVQPEPVVETVEETTQPEVVETVEETVTIVSQETRTEAEYWLRLDKEYLPEEVLSSTVEERPVDNWLVTYRIVTFVTPEIHTHVYATDTYTITTYSNGNVETELTNQSLRYREPVTKYPVASQRTEEVELMRVELGGATDADTETDPTVIGDDHPDMGTRTPGYVEDRNYYRTSEFSEFKTTGLGNNHLLQSNFDVAYSRGWTGKGSLVVVADTGADTSHIDLDNNIAHTIDYTGSGISNASDHGTHVAGIIAAEKNGVGMHGAAFDAKLAIAKVADGYAFSFFNAQRAAAWGKELGAVAINVSAETRLDTNFKNSLVQDADGVWHSNHWYYGVNGYNGAVNEAVNWKTALGNEMVLVKAAGNAGTDFSAGMNQMATATDSNGNLILDGQMIIVGSYDRGNQYGNKAGTVCATYVDGVCKDAAKIKDFFILADGYMVDSTAVGGGYVNYTGTSMAAPVVSGAIAILHQMWPHMKGKHLVQLVLVTAKDEVLNSYGDNVYDENLHGHGILDMDAATRPVGATGIPTSGRTDGGVSTVLGGANVSGVAAQQLTALTNVMVLDSFERDFYIDLSSMVSADIDTRTASVAEQMGAVNYFAGYMNADQHGAFPWSIDQNNSIEIGFGKSDGHYLGNSLSGTLGTTKDSTTVYANYNYRYGGFYAQAGLGYTSVNFDKSNSMLVDAENVISSTATVGYELAPTDGHTLGFAVSQPVTVESAKFTYRVPTSRTLDGNVNTELRTVDFRNSNREIDFGTYYNFDITKTGIRQVDEFATKLGLQGKVGAFVELRDTITGVKKEIEKRAGISVKLNF